MARARTATLARCESPASSRRRWPSRSPCSPAAPSRPGADAAAVAPGRRARADRRAAAGERSPTAPAGPSTSTPRCAALRIEPSAGNLCAVLAVTEQESSFRADPTVPGLGRDRARGDRSPRRARRRAEAPRARGAAAALARRPHLQRAHRRGEDREGAERPVRGLHRHGAAGPALLRRLQPGAHRRADAGEHRVRRAPRGGAARIRTR